VTAAVVSVRDAGASVPAWTMRLVVAVVAAGIVGVMRADGAPVALVVVGVLLALASVLSPGSAAPAGLSAAAAVISAAYTSGVQLRPAMLALVVLVHLLHVTSGLAAILPRGARLHVSALHRPLRRFVAVQIGVLALVGVASVIPGGPNPWHLEVIAILGMAGLAAVALLLVRRR
jgi:hypothetical protein